MSINRRLICIRRAAVLFAGVIVVAAGSAWAADGSTSAPGKEQELLAVLRSDAPPADKAITCKRLAIYGSSAAVPDLTKLLADPQLSSWARIALEAIPGSAADEALRKGSESLQGKLLVGTLNSIGVRRDAKAVELLTKRLRDDDAEVASAAAVALGHIGNAAAAKVLRQSLAGSPKNVRSAIAEGCVLCAERLVDEGKEAEAVKVYNEVRKADVSKQRVREATRGAIVASKQAGIPLLLENLRSPDKALFQLALSTAREFPGDKVDQALATEVTMAPPERAALILGAMADRKATVVLPAVLQAAEKGPKPVRLAAVAALGRVGDASCVAPLLEIALESDAELRQAATTALAELPDEKADAQIEARLSKAEGKMFPLLIEVAGKRRIDAGPTLVKALDSSDSAVRSAALAALGETVDLKGLPVLIAQAVAPKHPDDAAAAQQALKTASARMADRDACAALLATALDHTAAPATKLALLQALGAVQGTKALATVGAAAKSDDPELKDAGSRLLGEWTTADAAPVLLDLAKTTKDEKYQVRALRGYIRIARQFILPEKERIEMCRQAMAAAHQPAEKELVLEVLKRYPSVETLDLAIQALQTPELKSDAKAVALAIATKLGGKGIDVSEQLNKAGLREKAK